MKTGHKLEFLILYFMIQVFLFPGLQMLRTKKLHHKSADLVSLAWGDFHPDPEYFTTIHSSLGL